MSIDPQGQLGFRVEGAEVNRHAVSPQLELGLRVTARGAVHGALLRCLVQVALPRRAYDDGQQRSLIELFGPPSRWAETAQGLLWTQATLSVPSFEDEQRVAVPLPCTFDQQVAASKLLTTLRDGDLALSLSFAGTVFFPDGEGRLRATPIPANASASYRLPVGLYAEALTQFHADGTPVCVAQSLYARLEAVRLRRGLATMDALLERLLVAEENVP